MAANSSNIDYKTAATPSAAVLTKAHRKKILVDLYTHKYFLHLSTSMCRYSFSKRKIYLFKGLKVIKYTYKYLQY